MMTIIQLVIFLMQSILGWFVGYLLLLTGASRRAADRTEPAPNGTESRFLVVIPAHNEEQLLPKTLENLACLDYPRSLYTVHVVADNCSDRTAEVAASGGAVVHVRNDRSLIGKGYALQWLLEQFWQANVPHDAVVFLDADSVVSENFLQVMSARIARGEKVIQSYYAVRDPEKSWNGALRYAALAVLHYLRPQARMVLGGSVGLKGNGMVFAAETMRNYPWPASLTEDIEQHMALVMNGERVTFAPDAVVWGEMPNTLSQMQSQHQRWERGRLDMAKQYVPALIKSSAREVKSGNRKRAFLFFDAAMEHLIPPFSVMAGLSGLFLVINLVLAGIPSVMRPGKASGVLLPNRALSKTNLLISIALVLGQLVYLLSGLRQVRAPGFIYKNLVYVPVLVAWKIKQYLEAMKTKGQSAWVRTARNEG